ncbi:hypothetical protein MG293_008842 [Ovis ammon polii]|uniref:G-protein coupled receptors family 1 profile domain-containing protein n=1 Tax=Ovis ammon polii TaxID=230172 RepID=A0AAD4UDV8_OVIAM|nr:hypothetical protein MG293_008842 [Ovis ammon polii]
MAAPHLSTIFGHQLCKPPLITHLEQEDEMKIVERRIHQDTCSYEIILFKTERPQQEQDILEKYTLSGKKNHAILVTITPYLDIWTALLYQTCEASFHCDVSQKSYSTPKPIPICDPSGPGALVSLNPSAISEDTSPMWQVKEDIKHHSTVMPASIVDALLHSLMVLQLTFCTDLEIPLFFCEVVQVIKLACSDTLINNILIYLATSIFGGIPVCGIIFSYSQIVSSVLRMPSASGKYKAFSTCGSHLSVVSLFYGTGFGVYISSALTNSSRNTAVLSMMYTVVPQMMNPFIYSLRNRDMKGALRKLIVRTPSFP